MTTYLQTLIINNYKLIEDNTGKCTFNETINKSVCNLCNRINSELTRTLHTYGVGQDFYSSDFRLSNLLNGIQLLNFPLYTINLKTIRGSEFSSGR